MKTLAKTSLPLAFLLSLGLAACGGSVTVDGGSAPPAPLTLTGTVATGKAVAAATVKAVCLAGNGAAVSAADGTYAITMPNAALPCAIEASIPGSTDKLHALAYGSGSTLRANLTPLTELLVARLSRSDPAAWFSSFGPAAAASVTPVAVAYAQADVATALVTVADLSVVADFLSSPLQAAVAGGSPGDVHDRLLDTLKQKLSAAQITQVRQALAANANTLQVAQLVGSFVQANPVPQQLAFTLVSDLPSGITTEQNFVITDAATWTQVWRAHTAPYAAPPAQPQVDFAKSSVVGVIRRTFFGGTFVQIRKVYRLGQKVFVEYALTPPASLGITSYRSAFAITERIDVPVEFIDVTTQPAS
ncbi:hypothetical protein E4K72_02480 [Oxalobacteraceae bacterium OM1]|nr:hypothetical protein E4K72_02480 [Oxalobacteraceae bacterium OM1]